MLTFVRIGYLRLLTSCSFAAATFGEALSGSETITLRPEDTLADVKQELITLQEAIGASIQINSDNWDDEERDPGQELTPWYTERLDSDFESALSKLRLPAGSVLDLGCGSGTQALELAASGWRAIGIDISVAAVRLAQERARERGQSNASFYQGNLLLPLELFDLPVLKRGSFDVILDRAVFHTLYTRDSRVEGPIAQLYMFELRYLLKPGGYLLLKAMDVAHFHRVASWVLDGVRAATATKLGSAKQRQIITDALRLVRAPKYSLMKKRRTQQLKTVMSYWFEFEDVGDSLQDVVTAPYGFAQHELRSALDESFHIISYASTSVGNNKTTLLPAPPYPFHFFVAQSRSGLMRLRYEIDGARRGLRLREIVTKTEFSALLTILLQTEFATLTDTGAGLSSDASLDDEDGEDEDGEDDDLVGTRVAHDGAEL